MIGFVVMMHLTVTNADTGEMLYEHKKQMPDVTLSADTPLSACIAEGIEEAKQMIPAWRVDYPNGFVNVTCNWEKESDPA